MQIDKNFVTTVFVVIVVGLVGIDFLLVEPAVVGAVVDYGGLTTQEAGWLASTHMGGAMIGTIIVPFVIAKWNLRRLVLSALCLIILSELSSVVLNSLVFLGIARFFAGLGDGLLYATAAGVIAGMRQADRIFGLFLVAQFLLGAFGLYILPKVLPIIEVQGIFYSFAAMAGGAVCVTRWFPVRASDQIIERPAIQLLRFPIILSLVALLIHYIANGAMWAYLDRIGVANGISPEDVGFSLSISMVVGIFGALIPVLIGVQYGRFFPFLTGLLMIAASALLLMGSFSLMRYAIAVCIFNFALSYTIPYFMGLQGSLDPQGRIVAMGVVMIYFGLTLGPVIGSLLVTDDNFVNMLWMTVAGFMLSLTTILLVVLPSEGWLGEKLISTGR